MAILPGPSRLVDAEEASLVVGVLTWALAEARKHAEDIPARLLPLVDDLEALAAHHRGSAVLPGTCEYRSDTDGDGPVIEWVSTAAASQIDGSSPRNLRKRAERGTIPARKVGRVWQFDRAALRAC